MTSEVFADNIVNSLTNESGFASVVGDYNLFPDLKDQCHKFMENIASRGACLARAEQDIIVVKTGCENRYSGKADFSFIAGVNDISMLALAAFRAQHVALDDKKQLSESLLAIYSDAEQYLLNNAKNLDEYKVDAKAEFNVNCEAGEVMAVVPLLQQYDGLTNEEIQLERVMYLLQTRLLAANLKGMQSELGPNATDKILRDFIKEKNVDFSVVGGLLDRFVSKIDDNKEMRQLAVSALPDSDAVSSEGLAKGVDSEALEQGVNVHREGYSRQLKRFEMPVLLQTVRIT